MKLKFEKMPLGTRFKYPDMPGNTFVVVGRYREDEDARLWGTVAAWQYEATMAEVQGLFTHDPDEYGEDTEFEVVDHEHDNNK